MRLGLSSPRNTTSRGSPAGKINILDLKEDRLLAQHNSSIAGCVTESMQRIGGRQAEPLVWDVRSARSLFAKSAGKRGMINMHNFT